MRYQVFDPSETRVLVTHGAYGRDGLLAQLAMVLKTDLTISGALHCQFRSMTMSIRVTFTDDDVDDENEAYSPLHFLVQRVWGTD